MDKMFFFASLLVAFLGALTVANPIIEGENGRDERAPNTEPCNVLSAHLAFLFIQPKYPFWKRCRPKGEPCQCEEGEYCLVHTKNRFYCQGENTKYPKEPCDDNDNPIDTSKPFAKKCEMGKGCMCEEGDKCRKHNNEFRCQGPNSTHAHCDDHVKVVNYSFDAKQRCSWGRPCMCKHGDKCRQIAGGGTFCEGPSTQWKSCDDKSRTIDEKKPFWKRCTPGRNCECSFFEGNTCLKRKGKNEYYCQGGRVNKCERQTKKLDSQDVPRDGTAHQCRMNEECECHSSQKCLEINSQVQTHLCISKGVLEWVFG